MVVVEPLPTEGHVVVGPQGQSVRSMLGVAERSAVYSEGPSENMVASSVPIAGPAGYQNSEHCPAEP